jgi:hypothetical protein
MALELGFLIHHLNAEKEHNVYGACPTFRTTLEAMPIIAIMGESLPLQYAVCMEFESLKGKR